MTSANQELVQWTIYTNIAEYPNKFVAVKWLVLPEPAPTTELLVADTLMELRGQLCGAFVCTARHESDDPTIVEVWI